MKQNIKLFFKSLVSNNACIDGARKKPWYAAIIIFFISIILSVVPTTVLELKNHADKKFDSNSYGLVEATHAFSKHLNDNNVEFYVQREEKSGYLVSSSAANFEITLNKVKYVFTYVATTEEASLKVDEYKAANVTFMIFTPNQVYVSVMNPNSPDGNKPVASFACIDAYKKIGRDDIKNAYVEGVTEEKLNNNWSNWKALIRKFYNRTRLRAAGMQLGITSAINAGVVLIMGFMVWVLTRGKNNPYRLFSVWNGFATGFWAALTPALLTLGLGFLIKNFASMIFPLLLGVRVMWLTMKSLRPDGSGYAAN